MGNQCGCSGSTAEEGEVIMSKVHSIYSSILSRMEGLVIYKQLMLRLKLFRNRWRIWKRIILNRLSRSNLALEATKLESRSALENTTRVILTTILKRY